MEKDKLFSSAKEFLLNKGLEDKNLSVGSLVSLIEEWDENHKRD